ncbi:MAG: ammonium transporter [Lachnospiraceae bacterium]|jgi:Amt family ammonium transporter|nr:ammonium transporter [Lachnospiraceae bacterium]
MGLPELLASGFGEAEAATLLLNTLWTLIGAVLVFFMQAGFAAVETGLTRAKNAGNIIMKNLMDYVIGSICFFLIGFAFMFGGSAGGILGVKGFFSPTSLADANGLFRGLPIHVFLIFHTVFCATAATIVSGAMAERTKFAAYLIYSAGISIFIYPITGNWVWGDGWLGALGYHDFAGSSAVHMVGGACALVGAAMLGARYGKYSREGKPRAIPGHNLPLTALGVFILWFCWFGFNCGSTTAVTTNLGDIAVTTNLAAAAAALVSLLISWVRYGKPDVPMTFNGVLAGLVAITAGCDVVGDYGALAIGAISGVVVVFALEFIDRVLKVDDPAGAITVHGVCGFLGTILTAVFAKNSALAEMGLSRIKFLAIQAVGVFAVLAYALLAALVLFFIIKETVGLRVPQNVEIDGLDLHEHGISAYANFRFQDDK